MSLKWTEVSSTFNIEAYTIAVIAVGAHAHNVKMATIVGILTLISMKNITF